MVMDREASSWALGRVQEMLVEIGGEYLRPSVVFRPQLYLTCDRLWTAAYRPPGNDTDLPYAFYAKGKTPDEAMRNFDKAWRTQTANAKKEETNDHKHPQRGKTDEQT